MFFFADETTVRTALGKVFDIYWKDIVSVQRLSFCILARHRQHKDSFILAPHSSKIYLVRYSRTGESLRRKDIPRYIPCAIGNANRIFTERRPSDNLFVVDSGSEQHYLYSSEFALPVEINKEFVRMVESRAGML